MSYVKHIDKWLDDMLEIMLTPEQYESVVMWIKASSRQAYKKGRMQCPKCNPKASRKTVRLAEKQS